MKPYIIKTIGNFINLISYPLPKYAAKQAVKIFSTPRKGRLSDIETHYLENANQETVIYNDVGIKTYHWSGTKKTVLLVHGWESNAFRWKDLIEILKAENFNIIAIDAPAHGNSGSKIFNAILYSECINKVIKKFKPYLVVGHSIGGTSSALAINNYKLDVKKLALLGSPSNFDKVVNNYIKLMGYNKKVITAMTTYFLKNFDNAVDYYTIENFSQHIKAQGLIIHDKKDRIISFKDALHISKHYKNSKLIKTVGFGHGLKNEQVYNHILEFLND